MGVALIAEVKKLLEEAEKQNCKQNNTINKDKSTKEMCPAGNAKHIFISGTGSM